MSDILARKALRHRTVDALIEANVAAGNVNGSRVRPLRDDGGESVLVYTTRESGANLSGVLLGPPSFQTTIDLVIAAAVPSPDEDDRDDEEELDDRLDDLADEILAATLENAAWLEGIESLASLEIVKHPAGADGKPVLGGLRISLQVGIGTVFYNPALDQAFETLGAKPVSSGEETRKFGVDVNGDGNVDVEFEDNILQD